MPEEFLLKRYKVNSQKKKKKDKNPHWCQKHKNVMRLYDLFLS